MLFETMPEGDEVNTVERATQSLFSGRALKGNLVTS